MDSIARYINALRMRTNHASETLVLEDVVKHLDRVRLFAFGASFWTLRCKHTSKTKTSVKRKI